MNFQSLRRTSVAYLIFLALCIPLAIAIGVLFRSSVLALFSFFRGTSRCSSFWADQSVAGRIGTAIGFSVVFLSILEIVYTALLIPGNPLTIVGPLFLWTTLYFVFALVLET